MDLPLICLSAFKIDQKNLQQNLAQNGRNYEVWVVCIKLQHNHRMPDYKLLQSNSVSDPPEGL